MFRLSKILKIDKYTIHALNDLKINSTWENLTDTCTLTFPRKITWDNKNLFFGDDAILKKGMAVEVSLGYDDVNVKSFTGYIRDVGVETPAVLQCEDAMFLLKKGSINFSGIDVSLTQLLAAIIPNSIPYQVTADRKLGQWRISQMTPSKILKELNDKYFIRSFFRDGVLYSGLAYVPALQKRHKIQFNIHVIDNNLEYRKAEDVQIQIKGIINYDDNKKEEIVLGDEDGEVRTFHYYNISKDELKKNLQEELNRLKFTGYRGSITIFGSPHIDHGDVITLSDPFYGERNGSYLIKSVNRTFGVSGYRQELELERKI